MLFGKMFSSKYLPPCGTESEIERMTDFETMHSSTDKIKSSSCLWQQLVWPAAIMQPQMIGIIELAAKPGGNVDTVL